MALPPSHSSRVGACLCFSLQGSCGLADQPWHPPAAAKAFTHITTTSGVGTCKFPMDRNSGPCSLTAFPMTALGMSCACRQQDIPGAGLALSAPAERLGKNKGRLPTVVLAHQQDLQCFPLCPTGMATQMPSTSGSSARFWKNWALCDFAIACGFPSPSFPAEKTAP